MGLIHPPLLRHLKPKLLRLVGDLGQVLIGRVELGELIAPEADLREVRRRGLERGLALLIGERLKLGADAVQLVELLHRRVGLVGGRSGGRWAGIGRRRRRRRRGGSRGRRNRRSTRWSLRRSRSALQLAQRVLHQLPLALDITHVGEFGGALKIPSRHKRAGRRIGIAGGEAERVQPLPLKPRLLSRHDLRQEVRNGVGKHQIRHQTRPL